jgi:hypothetical protein
MNEAKVKKTDVSGERIVSIIRVTRISEQGSTLAVTINRSALGRNTISSQSASFASYW